MREDPSIYEKLRRAPYRLGGRSVEHGIDCLGVVLQLAKARGIPTDPDPWPGIRRAYLERELPPPNGFPPGWCRVADNVMRDDDVVILPDGVGYYLWGVVYSANAHCGSFAQPPDRLKILQVWRYMGERE